MEAKVKRQIILLSILLHILILAFWDSFIQLDITPVFPTPAPAVAASAPLEFDLAQPELPREVIATPADAKTTPNPERADFLSDKNALARNQVQPQAALPLGDSPYATGDFPSHDLFPQPFTPEKQAAAAGARPGQKTANADQSQADADQEPLSGEAADSTPAPAKPEPGQGKTLPQPFMPGVAHDHPDSQVADSGGLSFNTYNWDFAPYMLELKERIRRNIFPPIAFSQLGLIDGNTQLRFKIYPSGELRDLELLAYEGHRSLMETSTTAIKVSAPFRKLPGNFPEPYLQVTARFSFFIKNKRG
jgi:hypothetical protein